MQIGDEMDIKQTLRDSCERAYNDLVQAYKDGKPYTELDRLSDLIDTRERIYYNYINCISQETSNGN